MTKQHDSHSGSSKFDLMATLRKPHGIAMIAVALGLAGWAVWTFWVW